MTTAQQSPNGHKILPPPCSVENPKQTDPADLPANKANNNQFASDDQVVERQKGVSPRESHGDQELSRVTKSTPLLAHEKVQIDTNALPERCQFDHPIRIGVPSDERQRGISPEPLPDRCQFTFSDARQCSMARSDIHPSLCRFHSEREDQLFGDPAPGGYVVGRALDLPELYSACRDLTTAAGVNRALGQVFRLLAQRRISRQEAATFGHLAQLLLRTISAARAESTDLARSGVRTPVESREVMRESGNAESTGLPTPEIGAPLAPRTILREPSPRPSTCRSEAPHSESSSPLETGSATATGPSFAVEPRNSNAAAAGSAQHKSNGAALSHAFSALARSAPTTPSQ